MSSAAEASHSANLREIVYNTGVPSVFDPSEDYFEASKLTRDGLAWETPGIPPLLQSPELQKMSQRASRRYSSRPFTELGEAEELPNGLDTLLRSRRSCPQFGGGNLSIASIHQILQHSYGAIPSITDISHAGMSRLAERSTHLICTLCLAMSIRWKQVRFTISIRTAAGSRIYVTV